MCASLPVLDFPRYAVAVQFVYIRSAEEWMWSRKFARIHQQIKTESHRAVRCKIPEHLLEMPNVVGSVVGSE